MLASAFSGYHGNPTSSFKKLPLEVSNASSAFDSTYPRKLCNAVAAAVHTNCVARGIQDIPSALQSVPGDIAMDEVTARALAA